MPPPETSRLNFRAVLNALANTGLRPVAEACGVDQSTISKWKDGGEIERYAKLLAACRLKVVPEDMCCFRIKDVEALMHLATQRLISLKSVDDLNFFDEDPE